VFTSFRLTCPCRNRASSYGLQPPQLEDQRREAAEKEAATRRATDAQVLEDAERLIAAWNERQALRAPMIFSPTIGAAVTAGYWFLWVRCPACRSTSSIDLRRLDRHPDAAVTSLIAALSCRSCRPNAPFAELVRLSRMSIADEMREEHQRRVLGE
jgi:beta-phosphoglucomutase-like phosphatase (HAD superfamily)